MADHAPITTILSEIASGDRRREPKLLDAVYQELHCLAAGYMRRERDNHTLRPSALINEAYVRLFGGKAAQWASRGHFYVTAAQVMRRILIDHARTRAADKLGGPGALQVELTDVVAGSPDRPDYFLELDVALEKLETMDPRLLQVVQLRFFTGLTVEEAADALQISVKTVKRDWALARVWL